MPNIKPVSDLRNYTEVLRDVAVGEPVFLTKNGTGFPTTVTPMIQYGAVPVFVDVTIPQYNIDVEQMEKALSEKTKAVIKLMGELSKGEQSAKEKGWIDIADVEKMLGIANG